LDIFYIINSNIKACQIQVILTTKHDDVNLIILGKTDFNGEMVVQNYLKRTGRGEWARQVDMLS